jgi:hypothetical protein
MKKLILMGAPETVNLYPIINKNRGRSLEENLSTGFVKLYRSIKNKSWYKKSEYVHLWIHLFISATRIEREDWFNGKPITLKRGQLITGRKHISRETGIDENKVERILKCFVSEHQIEQQGGNKSRLLSINNWHLYQNGEHQNKQQVNNKRTASEQQVNTIQEVREYKEERDRPHQKFFEDQISLNQNHPFLDKYKALVDFIQGKGENEERLENVLSLPKQITFKNYLTLRKTYDQHQKRTIRDVLESMEGKKDLAKSYDSVFWVANNWLKNEFKK